MLQKMFGRRKIITKSLIYIIEIIRKYNETYFTANPTDVFLMTLNCRFYCYLNGPRNLI